MNFIQPTLRTIIVTGTVLLAAGCSQTKTAIKNVGQDLGVISSSVNDPAVTITPTPVQTRSNDAAAKMQTTGVQSPNHDAVYQSVAASINPDTAAGTDPNFRGPQFIGSPTASDGDRPARYVSNMNLYGELPGSPNKLPNDTLNNLRQITFTPEGADFDVTVSPDGKALYFASTQHRPTADLYTKSVTGNTITQLTSDPANDTMPTISPDGKRLAFCSDRNGSWDLYVLDLNATGAGSTPVQLTNSPTQELHPSWSPDGRQIVFCSLGEQSGQWEIAVIDVNNPAQRRFLGYGLFPSFSPDGKKIAFQRARFRGTRWFSIWTLDYTSGEATRPTEIAASANAACINPTWSPDGKELAFVTVMNPANQTATAGGTGRPTSGELWVINVDGTGRRQLTTDKFVNLQPTWSRDGFIYFVSNRTGNDNLWAVRAGGQPQMQMADQGKTPATDNTAQATVPTE